MNTLFVSAPCIALLLNRHRTSVAEAIDKGRYGNAHRVGRHVYVDLRRVELAEAIRFTAEQVDIASSGLPDRIVMVHEKESVDGPS